MMVTRKSLCRTGVAHPNHTVHWVDLCRDAKCDASITEVA